MSDPQSSDLDKLALVRLFTISLLENLRHLIFAFPSRPRSCGLHLRRSKSIEILLLILSLSKVTSHLGAKSQAHELCASIRGYFGGRAHRKASASSPTGRLSSYQLCAIDSFSTSDCHSALTCRPAGIQAGCDCPFERASSAACRSALDTGPSPKPQRRIGLDSLKDRPIRAWPRTHIAGRKVWPQHRPLRAAQRS
jgi:hypothetical protein